MSFLTIEGITKRFGDLVAVDGVSLEIEQGGILSIIGPNGAGKTTFFNLLTGFHKPDHGRVLFKEKDITGLPPYEVIRQGISRSFQVASLFDEMTVLDNVQIGVQSHLRYKGRLFSRFEGNTAVREESLKILDRVKLVEIKDHVVKALSHGDRKILDLAMALTTRPEILLLDEPTSGLAGEEQAKMVDLISENLREELKLVIVEHDMDIVFTLSDRIMVLNQGKKLAYGNPREIMENEEVQKAYLGGDRSNAGA
ncbi:MAG: ABC transporter ATP-binding protein [Deltaproteobacteria bacterium]|nr:MAG: ABC transporter ATP-binding protein [Deltaproteobacteria bacterium]